MGRDQEHSMRKGTAMSPRTEQSRGFSLGCILERRAVMRPERWTAAMVWESSELIQGIWSLTYTIVPIFHFNHSLLKSYLSSQCHLCCCSKGYQLSPLWAILWILTQLLVISAAPETAEHNLPLGHIFSVLRIRSTGFCLGLWVALSWMFQVFLWTLTLPFKAWYWCSQDFFIISSLSLCIP